MLNLFFLYHSTFCLEHTVLSSSHRPEDTQVLNERLPDIIGTLVARKDLIVIHNAKETLVWFKLLNHYHVVSLDFVYQVSILLLVLVSKTEIEKYNLFSLNF